MRRFSALSVPFAFTLLAACSSSSGGTPAPAPTASKVPGAPTGFITCTDGVGIYDVDAVTGEQKNLIEGEQPLRLKSGELLFVAKCSKVPGATGPDCALPTQKWHHVASADMKTIRRLFPWNDDALVPSPDGASIAARRSCTAELCPDQKRQVSNAVVVYDLKSGSVTSSLVEPALEVKVLGDPAWFPSGGLVVRACTGDVVGVNNQPSDVQCKTEMLLSADKSLAALAAIEGFEPVPTGALGDPFVSPDGKSIALLVDSDTNPRGVYTVPASGGALKALASNFKPEKGFAWSPDNAFVAFSLETSAAVDFKNPSSGDSGKVAKAATTTLVISGVDGSTWLPGGKAIACSGPRSWR